MDFIPSREQALKINQILQNYFEMHEKFTLNFTLNTEFYDSGMNFGEILCPFCNKVIHIEWWQEQMNKCYIPEYGFQHLEIITPCCQKYTTLNDLKYYYEAGFSRFAIIIHDMANIEQDIIDRISMELQSPLKIIIERT